MITLIGNAGSMNQRGMKIVFDGRGTGVKGGYYTQVDGLTKFMSTGKKVLISFVLR